MADRDEAEDAVMEALHEAAKLATRHLKNQTAGSHAVEYASAVRELAEAVAWLDAPQNSH